jgi:hypothetical protein
MHSAEIHRFFRTFYPPLVPLAWRSHLFWKSDVYIFCEWFYDNMPLGFSLRSPPNRPCPRDEMETKRVLQSPAVIRIGVHRLAVGGDLARRTLLYICVSATFPSDNRRYVEYSWVFGMSGFSAIKHWGSFSVLTHSGA